MTTVDVATGEVLPALAESEARRLVRQINATTGELLDLIEQAWRGQAWIALGYRSWDALCEHEIEVPRLDQERRREMVGALRAAGMSTRAIGAATGVSDITVRRDLSAGASNVAPDRPVTGTDGKQYAPTQPTKTTVTERITETRQTVTEPSPGHPAAPADERSEVEGSPTRPPSDRTSDDDAEAINRGFRNAVDPDLDYRKRFTDALTRAHDVTQFDADRAIATGGESAGTNRHLVKSLADWCDAYLKATRPTHLRSAK